MSMPRAAEDLCSTVSTISSFFTEFDDNGREEVEEYPESPEIKHEPLEEEVKTELPDDETANYSGEDIHDDFLKRFGGDEEKETMTAAGRGREVQRKRGRRSRVKVEVEPEETLGIYAEADNGEDCVGGRDEEWIPDDEDDDWAPGKSKKGKAKSSSRGRGGSKRGEGRQPGRRMAKKTTEEKGEKENQTRRKYRSRSKLESDEQVEDGEDATKVKIEISEVGDTGTTGRRRKRISEMTPEQAERERARWREKREREKARREALKAEGTEESDTSSSRASGYRKKRVSEMTSEERAAAQARWRLQHQRRRDRSFNLPPEKIEEARVKAQERQRKKRALAKQGALPEEQMRRMEEQARKDRERKRKKRAAMTPDEKREWVRKTKMYVKAKKARMTEEEKKAHRDKMYMARMAKLAEMDPEQRRAMEEKKREKNREKGKKVYERLKETIGPEAIRERRRNWWRGMNPEKKSRALEKLRECYRRKVEALKQDPDKWTEVKQKWSERNKMNKKKKEGSGEGVKKTRKVGVRAPRKKWSELTEEEKDKKRKSKRDFVIKRKLAIQKLLDSGMSMEEIQRQTESPEQREARCIRKRLTKARLSLRKRLQSSGATPEEIQRKVEELHQSYQPTHAFRPYKPQPERWKPVDPEEVARLAAEGKLENLEDIKPLAQVLPPKPGPRRRTRRKKTFPPADKSSTTCKLEENTPSSQELALPTPPKIQIVPPPQPVQSSVVSMTIVTPYPPPQQQQQYSQFEAISSYQPRQSSQPVFQYPHLQPQQSVQSYSLQHVLDAVTFQEIGSESTSIGQVAVYQYDHSASNSQQECGSSYYGDTAHSPGPVSSPAPGNFENAYSEYSQQTPATVPFANPISTIVSTDPAGTSVKKKSKGTSKKPRVRPPPKSGIRGRGRKAGVTADVVCEDCGQAYTFRSITAHKNQFHNPSYDPQNKKCVICGVRYTHAKRWYDHYLRDHVRPNQEPITKPYVCEVCGRGYVNNENLKKHRYFAHGDGGKEENYFRCEHCPPGKDKRFKSKVGYHEHLKRHHPALTSPGHDCYRCDKSFTSDKLLGEHVGVAHPSSYFPCSYCTTTRFSQLGLYFHYRRCPKLGNVERNELRSKCEGIFCLQEMPISCELCGKQVIVSSLSRHYAEMHNVIEDKFTCPECRKEFKTREFWGIHMEEKHLRHVEDMMDILNKLNATNREGMTVEARRSQYARPSVGLGKRGRQKGKGGVDGDGGGGASKSKRRRKNKVSSSEEDEEEEEMVEPASEGDSGGERKVQTKTRRRRRRNVIVIAEEDELENQ